MELVPVEWKVLSEEWGRFLLVDGTELGLRLVVSDIGLDSKTLDRPLPNLSLSSSLLMRVRSPQELRERVREKPEISRDLRPEQIPDLEIIGIERIEARPVSRYVIYYRDREIVIEVEPHISAIARTLSYRDRIGNPLYIVWWDPALRVLSVKKKNVK